MLKEGDAAPDFVLKDSDGKDVRLSALQGGPVVLYFYPKDRTAGCTIEAKAFRDEYDAIAKHAATVVGVSLDDATSHCDFRDKHALPFPLLSDPDGRVHDLYAAWWTTLLGRNYLGVRRCTFIIDGHGIVRKVHKHVNPIGHAKQVLVDLEGLDRTVVPAPPMEP